jgi:membrane protein implicated in regulation of membrane protease activity
MHILVGLILLVLIIVFLPGLFTWAGILLLMFPWQEIFLLMGLLMGVGLVIALLIGVSIVAHDKYKRANRVFTPDEQEDDELMSLVGEKL